MKNIGADAKTESWLWDELNVLKRKLNVKIKKTV